jgi:hypothetical protein
MTPCFRRISFLAHVRSGVAQAHGGVGGVADIPFCVCVGVVDGNGDALLGGSSHVARCLEPVIGYSATRWYGSSYAMRLGLVVSMGDKEAQAPEDW